MATDRKRRIIHLASKTLVWSLIASVMLASLPIPIGVVAQNTAESDTPFPCRGGKCGCKSAFQCWTNCCCHSPQERLDWAKRNGVEVPAYGQHLKQLAAQSPQRPGIAKSQATSHAKPACCQTKVVQASRLSRPECCESHAVRPAAVGQTTKKVVLSMLALGCRGSLGELASLPWAVVPVPPKTRLTFALPVVELVLFDIDGPSHSYPPELPPPRLS